MPFPFIVVPTYHELANLPRFTERLWSAVPEARLLLVDDASGDGTPDWVRAHPQYARPLSLPEPPAHPALASPSHPRSVPNPFRRLRLSNRGDPPGLAAGLEDQRSPHRV